MKAAAVAGRVLLVAFALAVAWATAVAWSRRPTIPDRWNPWKPLHVADAPNLLTRFKLARLADDAALCRAALAESDFRYVPLPDRVTGPGCGFADAVRIDATSARVDPPFALSCRAAVSLALWEHHGLQPLAQAHFGRRVVRIEHFGSYACRNVYDRETGPRSRHATADALDVAGFVLEGGRRVRVLGGWDADGETGRFLHDLRDAACRYFDAVLGPDYNAAHRDHLHLDRGPYRACR
jgi:hypothetical protein